MLHTRTYTHAHTHTHTHTHKVRERKVIWVVYSSYWIHPMNSFFHTLSLSLSLSLSTHTHTLSLSQRSEVDPDSPQQEADARRLFEGMLQALSDVRQQIHSSHYTAVLFPFSSWLDTHLTSSPKLSWRPCTST